MEENTAWRDRAGERCPPCAHHMPTIAWPIAHLHGGDDEASVHDELTQCRRALVAVASVHHEQPADVLELRDGEVGRQRGLLAFLQGTRFLSVPQWDLLWRVWDRVVLARTLPSMPMPQSAVWIMLTSLPPSPGHGDKG